MHPGPVSLENNFTKTCKEELMSFYIFSSRKLKRMEHFLTDFTRGDFSYIETKIMLKKKEKEKANDFRCANPQKILANQVQQCIKKYTKAKWDLCQACKAGSTFTNHLGVMQTGGGDTRGYERVIKKSCDGTCKDLPCGDAYRKPHVIKLHTHTHT